MLLYRDGEFVQILEGDAEHVGALMARITADPRHHDVRVLLEEPLHARRFAEWTMGYEPMSPQDAAATEGYRDSFDDLRMGDHDLIGRALMELTMWFRVRQSEQGRRREPVGADRVVCPAGPSVDAGSVPAAIPSGYGR
jgi:hypothetical protein